MAQMNVSLPETLKSWAEARVSEGLYSSTSDYIRDLMRRDKASAEREKLVRTEIAAGLTSPIVDESLEDIIEDGFRRNTPLKAPATPRA